MMMLHTILFLMMVLSGTRAESQCAGLEDEDGTEICEILVPVQGCDFVVYKDHDDTVIKTRKDYCQKTCCMENEEKAVEQADEQAVDQTVEDLLRSLGGTGNAVEDPLRSLGGTQSKRQAGDDDDSSCKGAVDEWGEKKCDLLINKSGLNCNEEMYWNTDKTVIKTYGDKCEKTCCMNMMENGNEKKAAQTIAQTPLFLQLKAAAGIREVEERAPGERPSVEKCTDKYEDCQKVLAMSGVDCNKQFREHPSNKEITVGIDWCPATCGKCPTLK